MTHRELVIHLVSVARWRATTADRFADIPSSVAASRRVALALGSAARFVARLPPDDPDLRWLDHVPDHGLCEESMILLRRFLSNQGAWQQQDEPTETQMRNLLRRLGGTEADARAAARRRRPTPHRCGVPTALALDVPSAHTVTVEPYGSSRSPVRS